MDRYNLKHLRLSRRTGTRRRKTEGMSESNREETDKGAHNREGRVLLLTVILIQWERDTGSVHELHQWR